MLFVLEMAQVQLLTWLKKDAAALRIYIKLCTNVRKM